MKHRKLFIPIICGVILVILIAALANWYAWWSHRDNRLREEIRAQNERLNPAPRIEAQATKLLADDPVGHFKQFKGGLVDYLTGKLPEYRISEGAFDVKKTDSLVTPYEATLLLNVSRPADAGPRYNLRQSFECVCKITFHAKNGFWRWDDNTATASPENETEKASLLVKFLDGVMYCINVERKALGEPLFWQK